MVAQNDGAQYVVPAVRGFSRSIALGGEGVALALVAKRRAKLPPPERGAAARHAICDAVGAAVSLPFAEGMALEAQLINRLMRTPQSAALRHVFFATRAVSKLEELSHPRPWPSP